MQARLVYPPLALLASFLLALLRGSTTLRLKNNDARMSRLPSTTSPNTPPVPLPRPMHPFNHPFPPSRRIKHDGVTTLGSLDPRARSCALDTHSFRLLFPLLLLTFIRNILVLIALTPSYKNLAPGLAARQAIEVNPPPLFFSRVTFCDCAYPPAVERLTINNRQSPSPYSISSSLLRTHARTIGLTVCDTPPHIQPSPGIAERQPTVAPPYSISLSFRLISP